MKFTVETGQNNKISFLDVNITRELGRFVTDIYRSVYQQLILLREIFQKNDYPDNLIDSCFKLFLYP